MLLVVIVAVVECAAVVVVVLVEGGGMAGFRFRLGRKSVGSLFWVHSCNYIVLNYTVCMHIRRDTLYNVYYT